MEKSRSYRTNSNRRIVGADTTRTYKDGHKETVHSNARGDGFGGVLVGRITGVTKHEGGKSTYKKK